MTAESAIAADVLRLHIGPAHGRLTVQAFVKGLLSFMGHSPIFEVGGFAGEAQLDPAFAYGRIAVSAHADSLRVVGGDIPPDDRHKIEERARNEVLEAARFPQIRFDGDFAGRPLGEGRFALDLRGRLSLHGALRPLELQAQGAVLPGGIRITGAFPVRQSDFGIRPVKALGGALRLRDELRVAFDLAAFEPEPRIPE